jgi:broad specificity phosphatase PhoE
VTRIILLRHGATALNRAVPYRIQGRRTDPPLDALGLAQARAAAIALTGAGIRPTAVYTSPLRRAFETAQLVAEPHGLAVVARADLIEADVGRWEGRTWAEVEAAEPGEFARFMADPGTVPYPEGESFLDVQRRVAPVLERLAADHWGESIVVVGHNVVNRAVLAQLLGVPIALARALRQSNGGINVLEEDGHGLRVAMLNAALHLEGLVETISTTEGAGA